jgi:hypothetical protein
MPHLASSWHPSWHALGIPLVFPWHPLGIRLVYSWHRASIPVAIAPGPQRGNRSSTARKMLLKQGAGQGFVLLMQANIQLPISPA